jgi:hypothetical protein
MTPATAFVTVAAALLICITLVHVYWALGGRLGRDAAIPFANGKPLLRPRPPLTFLVAILLAVAALVLLGGVGVVSLPLPAPWEAVACWGVALIFAARAIGDFRYVGLFKRVRDTRFARLDSALYSPLCVFLSFAAMVAAL